MKRNQANDPLAWSVWCLHAQALELQAVCHLLVIMQKEADDAVS